MYLVDTSVWIFALRREPVPGILNRIDRLLEGNRIATTGMVRLELLGGTKSEAEFDRLSDRLGALIDLPSTKDTWMSASRLLFGLRRRGVTIPPTDALIAACAMEANAVLLHADAHFDLAARYSELETESLIDLIPQHP